MAVKPGTYRSLVLKGLAEMFGEPKGTWRVLFLKALEAYEKHEAPLHADDVEAIAHYREVLKNPTYVFGEFFTVGGCKGLRMAVEQEVTVKELTAMLMRSDYMCRSRELQFFAQRG